MAEVLGSRSHRHGRALPIGAFVAAMFVLAACTDSDAGVVARDGENSNTNIAISTNDSPTPSGPVGNELRVEDILGGVWQLNESDSAEGEWLFYFHGSTVMPTLTIESSCGIGEVALPLDDSFSFGRVEWHSCESNNIGIVLDPALEFRIEGESVRTSVATGEPVDMRLVSAQQTLSFTLIDTLGFHYNNRVRDYIYPPVESEGDEIPDDWTIPPPLSEQTAENNPLLQHMVGLSHLDGENEALAYLPLIGSSLYLLADESGQPIETSDSKYNLLSLSIAAFHGNTQPVVYVLRFEPAFVHPERGWQTACGGASGELIKDADSPNEYHFTKDSFPDVYEGQWFHGEDPCRPTDLSLLPILEDPFSIDMEADKTLTITGPDGNTQRFAWTLLDDLEPDQ